jgi:hypothetical protein
MPCGGAGASLDGRGIKPARPGEEAAGHPHRSGAASSDGAGTPAGSRKAVIVLW